MDGSKKLEASSSEAFVATARAKYVTPVDSANAALDMLLLLGAVAANPAVDRATLRRMVVDQRTARDKLQVEGRRDLLLDPSDLAQTSLSGLKAVSSFLPILGLFGGPAGVSLGALGMMVGDRLVDHGRDLVSLPSVQDGSKGDRNRVAADAKAEVADLAAGLLPWAAQRFHEQARKNPALAAAMADVLPEMLANDIDSAGQCVTNHHEVFNAYPSIVVQTDNSVVITEIDELRSQVLQNLNGVSVLVTEEIGHLSADLTSVNDSLDVLSGDVEGIRVYLEQQQRNSEQQRAAAEVERIRAESKARWEAVFAGAQGAVAGVSAVADLLGEPKLAQDVRRFGGAALQVAQSTVQVVQAVSALTTGLSLVSSLGAAAATGNMLGAVASLVSLWQPAQPDPSQLILNEIAGLHDAVDQLSEQLATGLSQIDQRLVASHTATMSVLGELVSNQRRTYEQVVEIRAQIVTQQRLLEGVVTSMRSYFQASARLALYEAVNAGLGYASRNSGPMTQAEHNSFASTFYTWATQAAFDAINQPGGSTDDADLVVTLGAGLTTDHLSLANRAIAARGLPYIIEPGSTSSVADLPNLEVWAVAVAAYAQLRVEWPLLADRDDDRSTEIQAVGRRVLSSVATLGRSLEVFESLIRLYRQRIDELSEGIKKAVTEYHHDHLASQLGVQVEEIAGLDIFAAPPAQLGGYRPRFPQTFNPGDGGPPLAIPPSIAKLPLSVYAVDDLLARNNPGELTRFGVRWHCTSSYVEYERFHPKTGESLGEYRVYSGTCYLDVTYDNIKVASGWTERGKTGTPDAQAWFRDHWDEMTTATFTPLPLSPAELAASAAVRETATQRVEAALDGPRRRACEWLDTQMKPGGDLHSLLQAVGGSRALLVVLIKLIFPVAARSDDLLRELLDGGVAWSAGGGRVPGSDDFSIGDLYKARSTLPGLTPSEWATGAANVTTARLLKRLDDCQRAAAAGEGLDRQDLLTDPLLRLSVADEVVTWAHALRDQRLTNDPPLTKREDGIFLTSHVGFVRSGPGRNHEVVAKLPVKTRLTTLGFTDSGELVNGSARWYRLKGEPPTWIHSSVGTDEPEASPALTAADDSVDT